MMKICCLLIALLASAFVIAQDSGYSVYYLSKYNIDASTLQQAARSERKAKALKRQALDNQLKTRLIVSGSSSFYYHFRDIDPLKKATIFSQQPFNHSIFRFGDRTYEVVYYKDTCIISDTARKYNWTITNQYKTIAGYKCQLAWTLSPVSDTIFAYYAIDIPYKAGPHYYRGLPGIIMEVFDLSMKWYFTAEKITRGVYAIKLPSVNIITFKEYIRKKETAD